MTETNFQNLYTEYSQIIDPTERLVRSYMLFARIAAGHENNEEGIDRLQTSMGENWMAAGGRFEKIVEIDPDKAFDIGIQLAMMPVSPNPKVEEIAKWVRGDGPGMLGKDELREKLLDYLSDKAKSEDLIDKLSQYLSYDFSKIGDSKEAFEDPRCYLSLSTILLGMNVGKEKGLPENGKKIFDLARSKINDPSVEKVIKFYKTCPDTAWLAEGLELAK